VTMLASLALHRMLKAGRSTPRDPALQMWARIWTARLERLERYLNHLRQSRKAQSMGVTRRRVPS